MWNLELIFIVKAVFILIGIWATFLWLYENLKSLVQIIFNLLTPYFLPQENKTLAERFGNWAVITGATDGIGRGYAIEFARLGINVVLVSRTESKLIQVTNEIESRYPSVKVRWIVADFAKGQSIYENLKAELESIPIGILVNNVGKMYDFPDDLCNVPDQVLWDMININIGAITMMTKIAVPIMIKAGKGAIINIGSGSELQPTPYMTVYGSSKTYVRYFTLALQYELAPHGITVQLVSPLFVVTKMNQFSTTVMSGGILIPDAETYAKSAVWTIGKTNRTTGFWLHSLQFTAIKLAPEFIRGYIGLVMNRKFKQEYFEQQNQKQDVKVQ